ncbi:MAG: cyclic nucleotide-binding domain-containing protein [Desulfobacteraceae bacterium]|nr:MAG: cyclic nucleotide-binding domain-containing protein [Desulfobacteraceae bacterium]
MAVDSIIYGYIVKEEIVQPDFTIIEEGAKGDWVYVVLKGRVKVKKRTPKGTVTIDTLGEGAIIGEIPFLLKTRQLRTASVIAEGVVKLGILDKERLEKEYELLSPQLKSLIRTLVLRLKETTKKASLIAGG